MESSARIAQRERRRRERIRRESECLLGNLVGQVTWDVIFICVIYHYAIEGETLESVLVKDLQEKNEILESNTALVVKYVHNGICFPKDRRASLDESEKPCIPCSEQKIDWEFRIYQIGCIAASAHMGYRLSQMRHLGQTN